MKRSCSRSATHAATAPGRWWTSRRGVAAVLAMMFLILFGSLSAAMAIASRGNITTAATQLHVNRAQSAAETGLAIARARLAEAANRFLVSESTVSGAFGVSLWTGNTSSLGTVQVLPPRTGRQDLSPPNGLATALAQVHALDQGTIASLGVASPVVGNAMAGVSTATYAPTYWVYTPAVAIEPAAQGQTMPTLAYMITYAPLASGTDVRAIVTDVLYKVDISTLKKHDDVKEFHLNDIGCIRLRTSAPIFFDSYTQNRTTGSFVLVDEQTNNTVAVMMFHRPFCWRKTATRAFACPWPTPCSVFSQSTCSMCFLSLTAPSCSNQYSTGLPYFFSMDGKYEAGPWTFSVMRQL